MRRLVLLTCAFATAVGCSSSQPDEGPSKAGTDAESPVAPRLALGGADRDRVVSAVIGQAIDITLSTIGPGQYGDPDVSSDAVRFLDVEFAAVQNPGGPTQIFHFECAAVGSATITIMHSVGRESFTTTLQCQDEP